MKTKIVITHKVHDSVLMNLPKIASWSPTNPAPRCPRRKWLRALQTLMRRWRSCQTELE